MTDVVRGLERVIVRLREQRFTVQGYPGWQTRGRGELRPRGVVLHHTAHGTTRLHHASRGILHVLANGHGTIAGGPICNTATDQAGAIYIIAAGVAWHAGAGGWRGLSGNSSVFGNEAVHTGSPSEPWTVAHLRAQTALAAELVREFNLDPDDVCSHAEWAPGRKHDPVNIHMPQFRRDVAAHLEDDMPSLDEIRAVVREEVERALNAPIPGKQTDPNNGAEYEVGSVRQAVKRNDRLIRYTIRDVRRALSKLGDVHTGVDEVYNVITRGE